MKKFYWGLCFLGLLALCIQWLSFTESPAESALTAVTQQYHQGLTQVTVETARYKVAAEKLTKHPKSIKALREAHVNTRLAFKRIAFLLEYSDRIVVRRFLNGPPLPFVDESAPWVTEMEPKGLQVLDELAFAENPAEEKEEIIRQLAEFERNFNETANFQRKLQLQHRFIFEAVRYELIRIFTLGVTGFDTPGGSTNALPEAHAALNATYQAIGAYLPMLSASHPKLLEQTHKTYSEALLYLQKSKDFDTFDRLTFLKSYINPLFALTYQVQKALNIETVDDVTTLPQSLNYHAQNIFANDLLNVSFYLNNDPQSITAKRIELGRILFFDPILSANNERSCASCHQPEKAFTDGLPKSMAFDHQGFIQRNSPTLINSVYAERYFYDLREPGIARQVRHVVHDAKEFNTNFFDIIEKIRQSKTYLQLFKGAYPDQHGYELSQWAITDALACYVASLRGFNSPFDKYIRGEINTIDPAVVRGFNLFMGKAACGTCHFAPTFNGTVPPYYQETESEVLGVPEGKSKTNIAIDPDLGRYASGRPYDEVPFHAFSFKTVTVRNVALTAPYMHNGVYDTLEEVMDFYNQGGGKGLGLDVPHQTLPFDNLNLTKNEIKDIIKFMEALTDTIGMTQRPARLPQFEDKPEWNARKIGGSY